MLSSHADAEDEAATVVEGWLEEVRESGWGLWSRGEGDTFRRFGLTVAV